MQEFNNLRDVLDSHGGNLKDLTVLAAANDPFRVDTDSGHRDGAWLANTLAALDITGQRHLRGLHYIVIGQPKPNGLPYTNTEADWIWLGKAAKAARWLRYIPFDRIVDQRNDGADHPAAAGGPTGSVRVGRLRRRRPGRRRPRAEGRAGRVRPGAALSAGARRREVLAAAGARPDRRPLRRRLVPADRGDLAIRRSTRWPATAPHDGRPMVVLYFADCDPAGWQMSISRRAGSCRRSIALEFGDLDLEVHRVGAHTGAGPGVRLAINTAEGHRAPSRQMDRGDGCRADRDRRHDRTATSAARADGTRCHRTVLRRHPVEAGPGGRPAVAGGCTASHRRPGW